jgi:ribosome maturation factor RimP
MDDVELLKRVKELILPSLNKLGIELYDIEYKREAIGKVLRIYIDKKPKVTIGDCEVVSEHVGNLLDASNLLVERYHLEVSSPGLDRPLKTERDFLRYRGEDVKINMHSPMEGKLNFYGKIKDFKNGNIILDINGKILEVPLENVAKAKLDIKIK